MLLLIYRAAAIDCSDEGHVQISDKARMDTVMVERQGKPRLEKARLPPRSSRCETIIVDVERSVETGGRFARPGQRRIQMLEDDAGYIFGVSREKSGRAKGTSKAKVRSRLR